MKKNKNIDYYLNKELENNDELKIYCQILIDNRNKRTFECFPFDASVISMADGDNINADKRNKLLGQLIAKEIVSEFRLGENIRYWFNPYIFQPYDKIEYKLSKFNGLFSKTRWAGYNRLTIDGVTEIDKGE